MIKGSFFTRRILERLHDFTSKDVFFKLVLLLFIVQAGWLASSAAYPMLYDEYYHPAVIEAYSTQYSPIISSQTESFTSQYGDITRTPSYMYHYVMSFPYRIVSMVVDSFYILLVSLRLINVAFVAAGLVFYRKLLVRAGVRRGAIHFALLILTLLPIFTHLAAHVNYDNLLFLLTPLFLLQGLKIIDSRMARFSDICMFVSLGSLAVLVKQAFLPIFVAAFAYVFIQSFTSKGWIVLNQLKKNFVSLRILNRVILCSMLLLSTGLLAERYVGNMVVYGTVKPKCSALHTEDICLRHPIIQRNYKAESDQENNPAELLSLKDYTLDKWAPGIVEGATSIYVNIGSTESLKTTVQAHEEGASLRVMHITVVTLVMCSLLIFGLSIMRLWKFPNILFFVSIFLFYFLVVWYFTNYLGYRRSGKAFAVQARYFILLAPLYVSFSVLAASRIVRNKITRASLMILLLLLLTQGGGVSTYVVRGNDGWYWQRQKIIKISRILKKITQVVILD